jgi:solute carrier family 25 folate transporter 32
MNENHARLSPALVETIAGLSAGTITTLAVHPLDVIKTRLQSPLRFPSSRDTEY